MSAQYLQTILRQQTAVISQNSPAVQAANAIIPLIRAWGGQHINFLGLSGSYAKGTAVKGGTDIDLFISLNPNLNMTLADIYTNLHQYVQAHGYPYARAQNVSVGLSVGNMNVDLVPAKQQDATTGDHSLYKRKTNSWTKTNVQKHVQVVSQSGRLSEIRLMKLWRNQKRLGFPSFYLELAIIEALRGQALISANGDFTANIVRVLTYLRDNLKTARIVDPANTNNVISDDLSQSEKALIAQAASTALTGNWGNFIS